MPVRVAVLGLWHLGSVTAACAAAAGHDVVGFDASAETVSGLLAGRPPIGEPGLAALVAEQRDAGRLVFTTDLADAVRDADVVWVTFDTPVDGHDRADTSSVIRAVEAAFPYMADGAVVLSSSQLPIGTVAAVERAWAASGFDRVVHFACSPENLRLGHAIEVFNNPDRVVIGVRHSHAREIVTRLFAPITDRIEWMSIESAEMTKHAINAFLATSVTFINELASLCELAGADAKDVERGLKTERRIGPSAYLSPGAALAGGTLARDVVFLRELGHRVRRATPLFDGVLASNSEHRGWTARCLERELRTLDGRRIAIWGLTYKPGTDTLRRSAAVDLCRWLIQRRALVAVHDPLVTDLPEELRAVERTADPLAAAANADAVVVATEWSDYRSITADRLLQVMPRPLVIDPNRFLAPTLGLHPRIRLVSVGQPLS